MSNIIACGCVLPDQFEQRKISRINQTSFLFGDVTVDKSSESYPSRSDEKVMRKDIIASIILVNQILKSIETAIGDEDIPLFVANGDFIESNQKYLQRFLKVYEKFTPTMTQEEKLEKMYRASPPLLAIETLTNSTMSFIAQYCGFKGHNATFGTTSISALYAIKEALGLVHENDYTMVLSSNCAGEHSFLTNSAILGYAKGWKESTAVGSLVLSKHDSSKTALAKITFAGQSSKIPSLESNVITRNWEKLLPDSNADCLFFSGAYTNQEYEDDLAYCKTLSTNVNSIYELYGNLGPSNIIVSISKGLASLASGMNVVDILDRDIYGRESIVRIERP